MTTYNIIEVIRICTEQKYKYIAFFDQTGKELIAFNSNNVTAADRLSEIQKRLESPALKDGIYCVKAKTSPRKVVVSDDYYIKKGDYDIKEVNIGSFSPEILSYDKALEMQTKIAKYEMEIQQLTSENQLLKLENAALEKELQLSEDEDDEDEDEAPTLAENAKSFLSEFLPILTPLIDKHFDLQQQKLNLEAQKILRSNPYKAPAAPAPAASNPEAEEIQRVLKNIQSWIKSKAEDENLYNQLVSIYNSSSGIDNFCELVNNFNPELYEDLRGSIE